MNKLNKLLEIYIFDPKYPLYNFNLAKCYEDEGHNASAVSFYLRCAEYSNDKLLQYESLLRIALCIERQGNRVHTVKGIVLRAISLMPNRPEAYYILSRICENNREWHETYTYSTIGIELIKESSEDLITDVGYPGSYGFIFEKAISAWWIGLYDESIYLLRQLDQMKGLKQEYVISIKNNIANYGYHWKKAIKYTEGLYSGLRMKFNGCESIKENYSQCYQDMFILTMLNGKRNGSYLEIGCGDPFFNNNTALLHTQFGWNGISIDIKNEVTNLFALQREQEVIIADATRIDYKTLLTQNEYGYLQIDCDPAIVSFEVLKRIPFETHKFAIVTFEHDNFCDDNKEIKDRSRKYLESFGYKMVVNNIAEDRYSSFEDWYIHPDLVDSNIIEKMLCISEETKRADLYMLGKI